MIVLIPWKPIVVVWVLLSAMLWCGYVGSSLGREESVHALLDPRTPRPPLRSLGTSSGIFAGTPVIALVVY
jgi:hypothetical protein